MKTYEYIAIYIGTHREPGYDEGDPSTIEKHNEWKGFESEAEMLDWIRQQRIDTRYHAVVSDFKILKVTEVEIELKVVTKIKS